MATIGANQDLLPARKMPDGMTTEQAAEWFDTHDTAELAGEEVTGGTPPAPRVTISVRLSRREIDELRRRATRLGIGHTTYIRLLVNRHVLHEEPIG